MMKPFKIADMHCDTVMHLWYSRLRKSPLHLLDTSASDHPLQIDLKKLLRGNYVLQNFAMFTDLSLPEGFNGVSEASNYLQVTNEKDGRMDPWFQVCEMIRVFQEEMAENADLIRQVRNWDDIRSNMEAGRISALLTVEEGAAIQEDLDRIHTLFDAGVRMMTLTWNFENDLGYPNLNSSEMDTDFRSFFRFSPEPEKGLKQKGFEALEIMSQLGILTDVSHLSDAGFYDVAKTVKGPFVASHSNARVLTGCARNLTDDMIRIIGQHGGVIGLNFCPCFVMEADREDLCTCSIEGLCRHARHIMNVGGSQVLGLGTDFDGIDPVGLEIEDAGKMQKLAEGFLHNGFTETQVDGILSQNVLRLYREVL